MMVAGQAPGDHRKQIKREDGRSPVRALYRFPNRTASTARAIPTAGLPATEAGMGSKAEKTFDGRGDRLSDARMSMLSGRAADDLRLSGLHLRLLAHLGRQNHRRGWLRISQSELAEQWDVSRQRVNMAIRDLVGWRYVLKRDQKKTGESFCTYKTRLDDPEDAEEGVSPPG
jgi:hypothetical protein